MVTRVIVNVTNMLLSMALVTGWGPFPAMGWQGIALGTACSHVIGATILIGTLIRGRAGLRLRISRLKIDRQLATRLLRVGVPGGVDVLLILSCHLWFVALINGLGNEQAAAHSLGIRIESLGYLPGTAFQVAATTLAGQYLGARDPRRAGRSVLVAAGMGGAVMMLAGLAFYVFGYSLATFFTGGANPDTAMQAARLLRIASAAMLPLAIAMVISGALRELGIRVGPLAINMLGMLGIRIPGTYFAITFLPNWMSIAGSSAGDVALFGAWCVMVVDIVVRAALVTLRFFQGGWTATQV